MSLPRLIVGTRHCRVLILGNINSDATGFDITGSQALPGNRYPEALPRFQSQKNGGRASRLALPGRAWVTSRFGAKSKQIELLDILTPAEATVIPKPHDLSFCFIATASTHKEFYGLTFAPQTNPASPAV